MGQPINSNSLKRIIIFALLSVTLMPSLQVSVADAGNLNFNFAPRNSDTFIQPQYSSVTTGIADPGGANIVFPNCENDFELDCLESLDAFDKFGNKLILNFTQYMPGTINPDCRIKPSTQNCGMVVASDDKFVTKADEDKNIPSGSKAQIWSLQDVSGQKISDLLVTFGAAGTIDGSSQKYVNHGKFSPFGSRAIWWQEFYANIQPIEIKVADPKIPKSSVGSFNENDFSCYFSADKNSFCIKKKIVSVPIRFQLKSRLGRTAASVNMNHWITARATDSDIKVEKIQPQAIRLTLSGEMQEIVNANFPIPKTEEGYNIYKTNIFPDLNEDMHPEFMGTDFRYSQSESEWAINLWEKLSKFIVPVNGVSTSVWDFHATWFGESELSKLESCNSKESFQEDLRQIPGLTYSNAVAFAAMPPTWNAKDQSLDIRVASLHLDASGEVNNGVFGLYVKKSLAECLWGTNITRAKAEISVIASNGLNQVATSVSGSNNEGFHFSVSGFHYSTNTIRIKFPAPQKEVLLKCKLGKKIITLKGLNKHCPKGYSPI